MTPTPRKARSGRRQFGPSPGTEQEWARVMQSPHIQRAFADPNIQQALMQHMQQQAAAGAPAAPQEAPPGMAHGGALHFDQGGLLSPAEMQEAMRQIADPSVPEAQKNNLRMRVATSQAQQSQGMAPLQIPGGGTVSASTMNGLNQMTGPPTLGNTAAAIGMGALMGAGTTSHQGTSALLGAGLSGALNYLIRKYGKNAQKNPQGHQGGGGGGGWNGDSQSVTEVPAAQASNPNWRNQPDKVTSPSASPSATTSSSAYGPAGGPEVVPGLPNIGLLPPSPPPGSGQSLRMGTANSDSGNVISRDGGKTWADSKTQKPVAPDMVGVGNQTQIDPGSSLISATPATTPPPPDLASLPRQKTPYLDDPAMGLDGFAEGGPVPEGPPSGLRAALPMPVLHIVIAGKPKQEADKKTARKVSAKPVHEDRPRAHGRVQVPRGSGAAIKGKRFGGIF